MKNFTNNFKQFTSRLSARWLIMALMMLVGASSAWAWGGAYRDVTNQPNESPTFYLGDKITFYWILDNIGSGAAFKKVYISTSSSNETEDWKYDLTWVKKDNDDKQYWKSSQKTASAIGTQYYSLWLGWGSSVGDNGRYYNGSKTSKTEGDANFIKSSFSIKALPTPTNAKVTLSGTTASLSWTKDATYKTVMIVRYAKGATVTAPTQGTEYVAGTSKLGTGTVIYKGTAGSTTNTVVAGSSYDYYFYTVNNNYYSSSVKVTADGYTYPAVSTISATVDGDNLVCEGEITSMGSATTVVWAFTVLSSNNISKATADWIYPDGQNKITAANTSFTYNIPISSLSLTEGNTYFVRAMAVDLGKPGISNNQYGNGVAGDAISFVYDPCTPPAKPTFDAIPAQCGSYTLPTEDKNKVKVNWYTAATGGEKITSVTTTGTYHAEAVDGTCVSENRTDVEITINPKPSIGDIIQSVTKPVPFEDVVLTADGVTPGAEVNWYVGENLVAENTNTYTVTSDEAEEVVVKAKAFLGNCESDFKEHKVTFSAEKCNSTTTTEQQTVGKTKIIVDNPQNWSTMKCYAWRTSDKKKILGDWSGTEMTKSGNNYEILIDFAEKGISENDKIQVIFNNGSSQTVDSEEVSCNKIYRFGIGPKSGDKYSFTSQAADIDPYTEPVEVTVDPEISAPAAKTISVSSTEGEGNIIFSGQVVKTGCANALTYGFAYSTDANADKSNWTKVACVNTGNTAGTQFNGKKTGIEVDGTYYVCAYITNSAGTTYGAVTEITVSTTKTPISNVTLNYCDENGGNVGVDPNPMCKGATAYVKLEYAGSNYSDIKWLVEGVETNLVTDKGNGVVWSYIIQGTGQLSVELRNDANKDNEGNPTWATSDKLSFTMKAEPAAPYISIDPASGIICEGSEATIKVENPSKACSYKLVEEEDTKAGFKKYESGDLKYTVGSVGKYYVAAKHIECSTNEYTSNQVAINQIIRTSAKISIEPEKAVTTPWEPVSITVTADEGYVYEVTYTGNNLQDVEGVIIKQKGDTYTYYIPRPTGWGEGNAVPVRTPVSYDIKAQLKVDGEANQCDLSFDTATITVKDEENEDCD